MSLKDLKIYADKIVLGIYPKAVLKQIHSGSIIESGTYSKTDSAINAWRFQYDVGETVSVFICANIKARIEDVIVDDVVTDTRELVLTCSADEYNWSEIEKNLADDDTKDERWEKVLPSRFEEWNTTDNLTAKEITR